MTSLRILTWDPTNKRQKQVLSGVTQLDVSSLRIGASLLVIAEASSHFDFGAKRITNLADPVAASDAVTKSYADSIAAGFDPKEAVKAATTGNLAVTASGSGVGKTLTSTTNGALVQDGVTFANGQRLLVWQQTNAVNNGVYVATDAGSAGTPFVLTRAADFDGSPAAEVSNGAYIPCANGTTYGGSAFILITNDPITVDTTSLAFTTSGGQVPEGTSGSGGAIKGRLTADSDKGLTVVSGVLGVNHTGEGLQFTGGALDLELDGATLSKSATGLKVANSGVTETQLAASVAGAGLTGGAGSALAIGAGEGVFVTADAVAVDYATTKTNDNGSAITVRQVVYVKPNGNVDLAIATNTALNLGALGIVEDASIAAAGSGRITIGSGRRISGFSGLTPGELVFVSRTTAGALTQSLTGFTTGEILRSVGRALTASVIVFDPDEIVLEY